MEILYLSRLDTDSPISKIHREVGKRSRHSIHGFVQGEVEHEFGDITIHRPGSNLLDTAKSYIWRFSEQFDVIHTGPYWTSLLYLWQQFPPFSGAVVHTYHNAEELVHQPSWKFRLRRRALAKLAAETTTPSEFLSDHIQQFYGRDPIIVPNGVDIELFTPDRRQTSKKVALYVGRFVPRKNPGFVIELARRMPDWTFKMRGSNSGGVDYTKRAKNIDNIEILPRLAEEELADEMSGATVLLAPFQYEGFGMVIIESFSSGTPIIGLDHGNVGQLLSKPSLGAQLNDLNIGEWMDSIRTIRTTTDEDVLRNEGARYSWDRIARQYDSVYERSAK